MPVLTASETLDMTLLGRDALAEVAAEGEVWSATATELVLVHPFRGETVRHVFIGVGLVYAPGGGLPTSGTITGFAIRYHYASGTVFELTGLSIPAAQLAAAVASSDPQVLLDLLFGGNDTLNGGDEAGVGDTLIGHDGADVINGGQDGGDLLLGGGGDDQINGGDEFNQPPYPASYDGIDGGAGNDVLNGGTGNDVILGGLGADTIDGGAGADFLLGNGGTITSTIRMTAFQYMPGYWSEAPVRSYQPSDRFTDDGVADDITAGDGDDVIVVGLGDDVDGGAGNDTVEIGFTGRTSGLNLTLGADAGAALTAAGGGVFSNVERFIVRGSNHADVVTGTTGVDTLYGGEGGDQLNGGDGNDTLVGATYTANALVGPDGGFLFDDGDADTLNGGEGSDLIIVGLGDSADGGNGSDTLQATLAASTHGVTLDLTSGDRWAALSAALGGSLVNFETLTFLGMTAFDDVLRVSGSGNFYTQAGDDVVHGDDANQYIGGGTGDDLIHAYGGADRLWGGAGDDEIHAGDGADIIYADLDNNNGLSQPVAGNDLLDGGAGNDILLGGGGDDVVITGAGADQVDGGEGFDILDYSGEAVAVVLEAASITVNGVSTYGLYGTTYQTPNNAAGGDAATGIERVRGTAFNDVINGGSVVRDLVGGAGDDRLTATYADARLDGGDGNDVLTSEFGNDTLLGGAGDDILNAGPGNDLIDGGAGNDTLILNNPWGPFNATIDLRLTGPQVAPSTGQHPAQNIGQDTLISIENVDGTGYGDVLHGNDVANILRGGPSGNYYTTLPDGTYVPYGVDYIYGHGGDDQIFGEWADEVGVGGFYEYGVDWLYGGDGNDLIHGGYDADKLYGEAGADRLYGDGGWDMVSGGDGNDVIYGGAGSDTLNGDAGLDVLYGGDDGDTLEGSAGDQLWGENGDDTLIVASAAGVGTLLVAGGAGVDTLRHTGEGNVDLTTGAGAVGGLTLTVSAVENVTFSGPGASARTGVGTGSGNRLEVAAGATGFAVVLDGRGGDDILGGGAMDDVLTGGLGNDAITGGDGVDTAVYSGVRSAYTVSTSAGGVTTVTGPDGTDTLNGVEWLRFSDLTLIVATGGHVIAGTAAAETIGGTAFGDHLSGLAGNDTLNGGDGDDVLRGGAGVDVFNGGAGIDTADYTTAAAGMRAQLNTNASTSDGDGGTDTFVGIENLTGSAFNDVLIGDGNVNVLKGGLGADTLLGLGGNDVLWGGSGALNTLQGGVGDDRYVIEAADSIVENAGEGNDTVDARIAVYTLAANVENLVFGGVGSFTGTGNAGANTITGGAGNDNLRGRGGVDVLNGGDGLDTADYTLAAAGVTARLDLNRATNDGDGATDTFTGIENLTGSNFNDLLIGDNNANVLMGGIGTDTLLGYGGDDVLWGGSGGGNNQLQGGTGDDRYILDAFDTVVELANEGTDTVEARIGSYTMGANIENLIYTGPGKFVGTGNALNNMITGGDQNDILRGGGGNDHIIGGGGTDEVQLRGVQSDYFIYTSMGGYVTVRDNVAGRDGELYLESIELLRFGNNTTLRLTGEPGIPRAPVMDGGEKNFGALTSPVGHDDFVLPDVLPALSAKAFEDGPQVLPQDDGLLSLRELFALHNGGHAGPHALYVQPEPDFATTDQRDWM